MMLSLTRLLFTPIYMESLDLGQLTLSHCTTTKAKHIMRSPSIR